MSSKWLVRFRRNDGRYHLRQHPEVPPEESGHWWPTPGQEYTRFDTEAEAQAAIDSFFRAEQREMPRGYQSWWLSAVVLPVNAAGDVGSPRVSQVRY